MRRVMNAIAFGRADLRSLMTHRFKLDFPRFLSQFSVKLGMMRPPTG
jgi:hypothetical protein